MNFNTQMIRLRYRQLAVLMLTIITGTVYQALPASNTTPSFPRIGNCYGAGLGKKTWEQGGKYWVKVDLFIGGGYDLHYDWDDPQWKNALATMQKNVARLKKNNPGVLILPYVDVIEGFDNPAIPEKWWDLNDAGERWSGWPGMYRINMKLPEVLQYNLDMVRERVFGQEMFDGVFYDCWRPDEWLCPRTAALRRGKAITMSNAGGMPDYGFDTMNGVLSEDEINRVLDGKVDFDDFMSRYLKWCKLSRKPVTTMIVCHPKDINDDPWRWSKMTAEQRAAEVEKGRVADEQTMRFGLTATLMGDGYFGYDAGTAGRGDWWWYKEYDAPLGRPKGDCRRNADGTWQREYEGGTVVVNGSAYDAVVKLPRRCQDISTGRVGVEFTLPMNDGRIFLPSNKPATAMADTVPRLTVIPPTALRATALPGGLTAVQTPGGMDLRIDNEGMLRRVLLRGKIILAGGFPVVAAPPFELFGATNATISREDLVEGQSMSFRWQGKLVQDKQMAAYTENMAVYADNRVVLKFDFEALTDLDIRMWRHYFAFPMADFTGAVVTAEDKTVTLPEAVTDGVLVPAAKHFTIAGKGAKVVIDSTLPHAIVDHRKHGREEYLLAGYPVGGAIKRGTKWAVETAISVVPTP